MLCFMESVPLDLFFVIGADILVLRATCESPGRKKESPITRATKNWHADSKTIRPKR